MIERRWYYCKSVRNNIFLVHLRADILGFKGWFVINVSFLLKKYYRFKSSLQKKLYICPVFNDIDHEWRTSSVRTMSIYNDKNYIDNVINLNLIKKQSKMTKNESKLLSIQGIAKASAFCLLLSAFSVNAADRKSVV